MNNIPTIVNNINSSMIASQISLTNNNNNTNGAGSYYQQQVNNNNNTNNSINNICLNMKSRFPRLQECAHFHYEVSTVDIPKNFQVILCVENESNENSKPNVNNTNNSSNINSNFTNNTNTLTSSTISTLTNASCTNNTNTADSTFWFHIQVTANDKKWIIYRNNENFKYLDKHLHDCIFDRNLSCLEEPVSISSLMTSNNLANSSDSNVMIASFNSKTKSKSNDLIIKQLRQNMANYLSRFCEIAFINPINCGPILNWFEIDNRGNRLFAIDDSPINIPGVAAAVVKKRYVAQGLDEISLDVGNMISVIDMPPNDESLWWRGKKELEVGFFPFECVELIKCNQHLSSNVTEHLPKLSQNQSVRLKHGKLVTLLRSFFNSRPARNQLQSKGILKQRVFACDLGEHLSNTQQDIPRILTICTEFIEKHGIVDGIYRHTGLQSNIQKLRNAFDEERFHEIEQEIYINDVHAVSSLLKMYFRELPNPLLTYHLYNKFIKSVNVEDKIFEIYDVVQQLPPPHYRTLAFLMRHLHRLSESASETNMNTKNLAIVWAPNLLKSKEMETNCLQLDMLHSITLQANISEFLIANADTIFNDKFASLVRKDAKANVPKYRPISVCYNTGASKLLSLEEAQDKYKQVGPAEIPKYHTVIDIPDHKKKKQKDKKAANLTANNTNSIIQPPANVHIQQQFEMLQQQQQQQQQQQLPLPNSASYSSVSSATATPLVAALNQAAAAAASQSNSTNMTNTTTATTNGNSSPALKTLIRNLRGSLKYPQGVNVIEANNQRQSTNQQIYENESTTTTPTSTFSSFNQAPNKLNRTNSNNSTFKSTPINEIKNDYSNCISQLQSAAAQAISSHLHGNLSPSEMGTHFSSAENTHIIHSAPAPVLFRNNKFNQSLNSNHSHTNTNQQLNNLLLKLNESNNSNDQQQQQQAVVLMSTFKDANSQSFVNNPVASSDARKSEIMNPIPSKRRTIQVQQSNNTLITFSQQQQQNKAISNSSNQINHIIQNKEEEDEEDQKENNKENLINNICNTNNHNNEDDMQQLVEYINQFEKENITTAVDNNSSYIEMAPILQNNKIMQATPPQESTTTTTATISTTTPLDIDAIENSSKLRLSSSSLSSSASSSNDINNDYDDIFISNDDSGKNKHLNDESTMATIKITPNETNPIIVSTNNLNSILTSSENIDKQQQQQQQQRSNQITSQFIDRRTYIINKVYDTLENSNTNQDDNEYEKVILNPRILKNELAKSSSSSDDYGEYHNGLLVTSNESNSQSKIIVGKTTIENKNNEHIYANVENKILPRESLGFEVNEIKNFDSEIVELNSQINNLLSSDSGLNYKEITIQSNSKMPSDFVKRRTTLSSCSNNSMDTNNKEIFIKSEIIEKSEQQPEEKPVSFRSKSCSTDSEKNQSDSSESISKLSSSVLKHEHNQEVRHSFRVQSSNLIENNSNADTNFKRKSSQSFEELNKKKSENNENASKQEVENKKNFKMLAKHRQSIQPSSKIEIINLTNTNRSMSKSLQDNSKLNNIFSEYKTSNEDVSESTNETNVKSKIKLMESFVGNQSTNHIPLMKLKKNERSSSTSSSASSSSSSKSPPLSPHLICSLPKSETSTSLFTTPTTTTTTTTINNETKQLVSKQNPPMVMARSVILTQSNMNNNNEKDEIQPLKSTVIIIDSDKKATKDEFIPAEKDIINNHNSEIIIKSSITNIKEKRKTVKEMISKFEPK